MIKNKPHILIVAGGTGGHVFPGLAIAQQLRAQGIQISWLGSSHGMENRVVAKANIPLHAITIQGVRRHGIMRLLTLPFQMARALWQTLRIFQQIKPSTVLGMGGFVSGPAGICAWLTRTRLVIHEQNAIAGLTNRWLARVANQVLESFPHSFRPRQKVICTGNPVRAELSALEKNNSTTRAPLKLLILGGSQGAQAINQLIPEALAQLQANEYPEIWHQTGERDCAAVQAHYAQLGIPAKVTAFIDDMQQAYQFADIVISRAGATTIAELTTIGLPSILIPLPTAVDDHQTLNAKYLVAQGAACMIAQADFTNERFAVLWRKLLQKPHELVAMRESALRLSHKDAAQKVATICLEEANV